MPQRLKTEVRDRILQAAAHTFAERGYGAAKMADIARTASIATSNIYKYYANKEALLDAVISPPLVAKFLRLLRSRIRHLEQAGDWPEDAAGQQGPAREMLTFWIENRLVICFLLQGAAGTRYAHIRDLVIRETARQAISYAKAQAGTEALAPHLEFTLNRVFTRTIDMIAEILWQFDDPAKIEQAFTLFWQYHLAGLQSLLKDHPAPNR